MASLPNDKNYPYYRVIFRATINGKKKNKTFYFPKDEYDKEDVEEWKSKKEKQFGNREWSPFEDIAPISRDDLIESLSKDGEVWKPVPGYKNDYLASNLGRIMSIKSYGYKILSQADHRNGYLYVNLSKNGNISKKYVHRLVCLAFLGKPERKLTVNHKDRDRKNNNIENLEWATQQENMDHYTAIRLKEEQKKHDEWVDQFLDKHPHLIERLNIER